MYHQKASRKFSLMPANLITAAPATAIAAVTKYQGEKRFLSKSYISVT
ncbi:hypothetical protein JCM19238_2988 [Vibrio ponticus]|nr:hypothetical protein JCM19238_2988 [Vibrio ponticus]